nr:hypothetical protein [Tanacetum cinerariifolium]
DLTVTYTEVSSPFEDMSDIGSSRVVVYGYDRLPMHPPSPDYVPGPEHPPSPDYVPGLEHPPSPVYVQYVPKPAYPEFMPHEDDVLPSKEQPFLVAVSHTANSPGYNIESDLKKDPDENDKDPEEDPADYSTNIDDDDDDKEEEESSRDDANNEEGDEDEDDEEEEDHLDPADSVPPPHTGTRRARISVRPQPLMAASTEALIAVVVATLPFPSPPPSPLTSYSSPLPQIPYSPLPASPTHPLGYKVAMIWLRAESLSTSHSLPLPPPIVLPHTRASMTIMRVVAPPTYILAPRSETPPLGTPPLLPIPLPTSSPHLLLPSINHRADDLKVMLPPRKRLYIDIGPRFKVVECSFAPTTRPTGGFRADYVFVGTLYTEIRRDPDIEIDFVTTVRKDTDEFYRRLDDAYDDRFLMSGQLNSLCRERHSHARTARLMESEARASRKDWKMAPKRTTRSSLATTTTTTTPVTDAQHKALIDQGVADALATRDANKSQNGKDSHDSGTGVRRQAPLSRKCTYPYFVKCKPLYFEGTEGVVELTQWFERLETVFHISNYTMESQIKFATCTLLGSARTWWNSYVKTVGHNVAYAMT